MKLTFNILIFVLAVTVIGSTGFAFALSVDSPKHQLESGVLSEDITCRDNLVLVLRTSGSPACVKETTADKLGWEIIKTEFKTVTVPTVQSEVKQTTPIITTLDMSSPVEFVDDGRVFDDVLQRRPAPAPMYDTIMESMNDGANVSAQGFTTFAAPSHEKYSVNEGVGLYAEDWMPTYIPDGYKLLYTDTKCYEILQSCSLRMKFMPNTFVLHQNVTDFDLIFSEGFHIGVTVSEIPLDEIEDGMEDLKESRESQPGNYGGHREMTRDGKTVSAYEGGNDLNYYSTGIHYQPDKFTDFGVTSTYLSLDELIPIFESIMK